jgi:hypothetical protein
MTILEALGDPQLLGAAFPDAATWSAWHAFLAAAYGLPMTVEQVETFRACTGRPTPPTRPAREVWAICGRRAGKSRMAATVAIYLACFKSYADVLARGEHGTLPIIAADRRQARNCFQYIRGLLEGAPLLRQQVRQETADTIAFTNGVRIEVHTASFRAVRGYTLVGAICDEIAFWRSDESANPDNEIIAALRPGMATVPGALLLAISSPYARSGALWEAYRRHYGPEGDPAVMVWQSPSAQMNPTLPEHVLTDAFERDEVAAEAEFMAQFRRDIEALIVDEALGPCIVRDRRELPPLAGVPYRAFTDPSGGSQDSFTLAIAHGEQRGGQMVAVLDVLRERRPPFSPDAVVEEFAALLHAYGCTTVVGDRYAGAFSSEAFARQGIAYEPSERVKSEIYIEFLPLLNSGRVELLDEARLRAQLLGLERRTARGGRESIDHGPGGRDDVANSAAGAIILAAEGASVGSPGLVAGQRTMTVPARMTFDDVF